MDAKSFIISSLKDTVYIFENIQCRYAYDNLSEIHYVEIIPSKFFRHSRELKNYRGQILDKFYEVFPDQSLAFISDDCNIDFKEEFKIIGTKYSVNPTVSTYFDRYFKDISQEYFKLTKTAMFENETNFDIMFQTGSIEKIVECKSWSRRLSTKLQQKYLKFNSPIVFDTVSRKDENTKYGSADQNCDALAA